MLQTLKVRSITELNKFLSSIPSEKARKYVNMCIKSGLLIENSANTTCDDEEEAARRNDIR